MRVGLFTSPQKQIDPAVPIEMARQLLRGGAQVCANWAMQEEAQVAEKTTQELLTGCDLIVVFGGDGTILGAARGAAKTKTPVLGINFGRLGFLTEAEVDDCRAAADALLSGDYTVEERMMLRAEMPNGMQYDALNDVTVSRSGGMSLLYLDMHISRQRYDSYGADGVIVASPTGSTAYALACGGPVVSPTMNCMVLCPICPHTLRARPVVLGGEETVQISVNSRSKQARVDADGIFVGSLSEGESVTVTRSPETARFIRLKQPNFYTLLRNKLAQND